MNQKKVREANIDGEPAEAEKAHCANISRRPIPRF